VITPVLAGFLSTSGSGLAGPGANDQL